jgi:RNase II-type exonuclease
MSTSATLTGPCTRLADLCDRHPGRSCSGESSGHHGQRTAGEVLVRDHAIEASAHGSEPLPLGDEISVRLVEADVATRVVRFESVTG